MNGQNDGLKSLLEARAARKEVSANFARNLTFGGVEVGLRPNHRYFDAYTKGAARTTITTPKGRQIEVEVALGSIGEVDSDTVVVPSNSSYSPGLGGVARTINDAINHSEGPSGDNYTSGIRFFSATEDYAFNHGPENRYGVGQVGFGDAHAFFAKGLARARGIHDVVMVNSYPTEERPLTVENINMVAFSSILAAAGAKAESIAFPEFGTGYLRREKNQTTREESWVGTIAGAVRYLDSAENGALTLNPGEHSKAGNINKVILVLHKNENEVTQAFAEEAGILLSKALARIKEAAAKGEMFAPSFS